MHCTDCSWPAHTVFLCSAASLQLVSFVETSLFKNDILPHFKSASNLSTTLSYSFVVVFVEVSMASASSLRQNIGVLIWHSSLSSLSPKVKQNCFFHRSWSLGLLKSNGSSSRKCKSIIMQTVLYHTVSIQHRK